MINQFRLNFILLVLFLSFIIKCTTKNGSGTKSKEDFRFNFDTSFKIFQKLNTLFLTNKTNYFINRLNKNYDDISPLNTSNSILEIDIIIKTDQEKVDSRYKYKKIFCKYADKSMKLSETQNRSKNTSIFKNIIERKYLNRSHRLNRNTANLKCGLKFLNETIKFSRYCEPVMFNSIQCVGICPSITYLQQSGSYISNATCCKLTKVYQKEIRVRCKEEFLNHRAEITHLGLKFNDVLLQEFKKSFDNSYFQYRKYEFHDPKNYFKRDEYDGDLFLNIFTSGVCGCQTCF